ncbi:MAG: hypothetical protein JRF63_12930 [Deltaproteobacteria bacterium]|nr:hypothetical protein [Deltaproteobacteria bacterium]
MLRYDLLETHVRIEAIGETRPEEWLKALAELKQLAGDRSMDAVLDFSRHESTIPNTTINTLVSRISTRARRRKWAFVVTRPLAVGLVNLVRRSLNAANIEVATFETAADAEQWIVER